MRSGCFAPDDLEMIDSTLCYIEKDGKYLMLLRNKKKVDCNKGKWIGVGGKREPLETVPECLLREVREETGLRLKSWTARAIIAFNSDEWEHERMFLFTADDFDVVSGAGVSEEDAERGRRVLRALETGEVLSGDEGDLKWIPKDEIMDLNLWEGDRLFMKMVAEDEPSSSCGWSTTGMISWKAMWEASPSKNVSTKRRRGCPAGLCPLMGRSP